MAATYIFDIHRLGRNVPRRVIEGHSYWEILILTVTYPNGDSTAAPLWVLDGMYAAGAKRPEDTAFYPMQAPSPYAALLDEYGGVLLTGLTDYLAKNSSQ